MPGMVVRIGKVSKIDYKKGLISATYPDLDDAVTDDFPVFSFTDEYKMPKIGQEILVLHLSNGQSAGIIMGKYWNKDNPPAVYGENVFRKELAEDPGDCFLQYRDENLTIQNGKGDVTFADGAGNTATLASILQRISRLESYH